MKGIMEVKFCEHGDERGSLIAIECNKEIPFDVNRVYYIYGTMTNVTRGKHAHKRLKQLIVCVSGSCTIMFDNGTEKENIVFDKPDFGIYIDRPIWREMFNFSKDCVLVVLADRIYETEDYIWSYDEFIEFAKY